ncbi:MAG: phosphoribosyltransferase [Candidatus Hydrogenedentota bacterium]|nr:MAG: phosphoribosyltransferase [Candidatus Hydrogenedentota bacterium]
MAIDPFEHEHTHVEEVPWSRVGGILIQLAETIRQDWRPEAVVGIAKGGVIPAVFLSSAFRLDFFPIKLSSRRNEEIVREHPKWFVFPTEDVREKKVLLVDHIIVTGRTIRMAAEELKRRGAKEVRTAALAAHRHSVRPDYVGFVTDGLIVWPWDRDCLTDEGAWIINPEYLAEMREVSNYEPGPSPAREPEGRWLK